METNQFTSSKEFTSSGQFKPLIKFSSSFHFSQSAVFSGSRPLVVIFIPAGTDSNDNKKLGIIIGASVGGASGVTVIVAAIVVFAKRTNLNMHDGTYINMKTNNEISKTMENPLVNMMGENDDPFEDDFNLDDLK